MAGAEGSGEAARELAALIEKMEMPRKPQQQRSREKHGRILVAAARLFAERGVEATSTRDIAQRAGVSIGTLYSYFKDKRQILLSLIAENTSLVLGPAKPRFELGSDPRLFFHRLLEEAIPYDPEQAYLRRCWADLTADSAEVAAIGERIHRSLADRLLILLQEAQEHAGFRRDVDLEATCWAVLSLFDRIWHLPNLEGEEGEREFLRRRSAVAETAYHAFFVTDENPGGDDAETDE